MQLFIEAQCMHVFSSEIYVFKMQKPLHFLKYKDNDRIVTFSLRFSVLKCFLHLLKIYLKLDLREQI